MRFLGVEVHRSDLALHSARSACRKDSKELCTAPPVRMKPSQIRRCVPLIKQGGGTGILTGDVSEGESNPWRKE